MAIGGSGGWRGGDFPDEDRLRRLDVRRMNRGWEILYLGS